MNCHHRKFRMLDEPNASGCIDLKRSLSGATKKNSSRSTRFRRKATSKKLFDAFRLLSDEPEILSEHLTSRDPRFRQNLMLCGWANSNNVKQKITHET
jgi:hypothetical protein